MGSSRGSSPDITVLPLGSIEDASHVLAGSRGMEQYTANQTMAARPDVARPGASMIATTPNMPEPWREFHPSHGYAQDESDARSEGADGSKGYSDKMEKDQAYRCNENSRMTRGIPPKISVIMDESEMGAPILKPLPSVHKCLCFYVKRRTRYLVASIVVLLMIWLSSWTFLLWPRPIQMRLDSIQLFYPVKSNSMDPRRNTVSNRTSPINYEIETVFQVESPNFIDIKLNSMGIEMQMAGNIELANRTWSQSVNNLPISNLLSKKVTTVNITWNMEHYYDEPRYNEDVFFNQCAKYNTADLVFNVWFDYELFHWAGYRSIANPPIKTTISCGNLS
jgi:hypothetical protein